MGDAGPPTPDPQLAGEATLLSGQAGADDAAPIREVKVLVTGFGPFKSFLINPSWLIASSLPEELLPSPSPTTTTSSSKQPPYKITVIIHPSPLRVAYATISSAVPVLIQTHNPDYILHIGMAGGRDCYSLETRAYRDNYRIKDVDDQDGAQSGEARWKREGVPEVLYTGWDEIEVLRRWEAGVKLGLAEGGFLGRGKVERTQSRQHQSISIAVPTQPRGNILWGSGNVPSSGTKADENRRRAVVKLSADAGRFLCEYVLFESLSRRWVDARDLTPQRLEESRSAGSSSPLPSADSTRSESSDLSSEHDKGLALSRVGKVAFLHVPGWTGVEDINRGVMVAEEAIRALVSSWEEGFRRNGPVEIREEGFTTQHSEEKGRRAEWRA